MDYLISRKAVIEAVDRHTREGGTLDDDISVILEEIKTAFDKEKVISQIQEKSYYESWSRVIDTNKAVWIVEKGGIE